MHIAVVAAGTRGDVEPYTVLCRALAAAGHRVRLASHQRFGELVDDTVEFFALPGEPQDVFDHPAWAQFTASPWRPRVHARTLQEVLGSLLSQVSIDDYRAACDGAEAVLFTMTTPQGHQVASELSVPAICVALGPFHRTASFAQPVLASRLRLGGWGNRATYPIAERMLAQPFIEPVKPSVRRGLGMAAMPYRDTPATHSWPPFPVVHLFSQAVVPRPADWPAQMEVAGFCFREELGGTLERRVEEFLGAGEPPVYVGFGSMRPADPAALSEVVMEGLRRSGRRAVVAAGWAGIGGEGGDPRVLVVDEVSHAALLPRVAGVVHHGGVGTTAAGLRAGRPTFVVPFVFDQAFWGTRVHVLGAGPVPVRVDRLSPDRLAQAIETMGNESTRAAAEAVGRRIQEEDGPATAVASIERLLAG